MNKMIQHGLSCFHENNMGPIMQGWEGRSPIELPALSLGGAALLDHARQMLHAFTADPDHPQSGQARARLGTGLYISREIAYADEECIGVVSNVDDETTFLVTMPCLPAQCRPSGAAHHDGSQPYQSRSEK
jgi:hypothetical protein